MFTWLRTIKARLWERTISSETRKCSISKTKWRKRFTGEIDFNGVQVFYFPHYLFVLLTVVLYVPTNIAFDYFIRDWMYTGKDMVTSSSATAAFLLTAIMGLHEYFFRHRLRRFLLPKHIELYNRLTAKEDGVVRYFPIGVCRKTVKWTEEDPSLDAVYRSLLQFGKSTRIIFVCVILIAVIMSALGYRQITG